MIVKINNGLVTIKGNPTLERNVKEELDTGSIIIESTRELRYEMYDKVDITTPYGDIEQYLIQADSITQLNATEYEHNLTLFENIAFFNTIYPADRSFKVIGQTLGDILNAYDREFDTYHDILISWDTIPASVLNETIPFKEFSGLNFSSILLSLFRKIWAVPKVNRIGITWDIYPLYHNEKNNSISEDSISKISRQNNVDYATKVKSQLKNAVNEQTESTWFPSENGYILPRSSSLIILPQNLRYELDSKITSILEVEATGISCEIYNNDTNALEYPTGLTVDISDSVIQDEAWDLLPVTTETSGIYIQLTNNVKNNVRYKVGQPYITNLYEKDTDGIIFDHNTTYLVYAIEKAISIKYNLTGNYQDVIVDVPTDEIKLRVRYVRQRDIDLIHNRKTKGDMNNITTIHQQRDASVEVNEYKKNLMIYSNRMGNNENSKTKIFKYEDGIEPHELFDYIDNKTIATRVQNTWHNTYVYCEYEESENFGNIEAEYALMRRSDPYTINSKAVTTNLVLEEYVEFSLLERVVDSRLTTNARELIAGLFDSSPIALNKVTTGVFRPNLASWNSNYAIHMPVETSGDGNLITLHVQFPHQAIAGKTYYDLDTDTYKTYLNPLPYTKVSDPPEIDDGTLTNYYLYYTSDVLFEDLGQYPLILDQTSYLANKYTESGISDPLDLDTAASFAQTFQVSFIADDNIYVGNAMASESYFVNDQVLPAPSIDIYSSTKPYGQYDQVPRTTAINGFDDTVITSTYNYSFANRTITITPSVAVEHLSIVKNGDILLAINKSISAGETVIIYINYIKSFTIPFYLIANSTPLSSLNGSATLVYTLRNYVLEANSIPLSSISGTAALTYTTIHYYMEAKSSALSSLTGSATLTWLGRRYLLEAISSELSNITGTATLEYSAVIFSLQANSSELNNISGTAEINYTERLYELQANSNELSNLIGSATLTYEYYNLQANSSALSNLSGTATLDYKIFEWVATSPTTPTGDGTCDETSDIGDIKLESESVCAYIETNSYPSATDITTTIPACSVGAEYTLCFFNKDLKVWACKDYEGQLELQEVYYECQLN